MDELRPETPPHAASLIYMIGRVDRGIRREMRARLAAWELSVAEYTTLSVLEATPRLSNAQLARRALVAPQSMIEILGGLERRDLVVRRLNPDHGRILRAELTVAGRQLLAAAHPAIAALQEELFAGVPAPARRAATVAMRAAMVRLSARDGLASPPSRG
jgi:DNA-binding MarR family transcriptional regulator